MLFYDNFERICRERGTSPSGACVAIGKNKTTAGNWKRNGTIPAEDILEALADVLGCEVSDFFAKGRGDDYDRFYTHFRILMDKPRADLTERQREVRDAIAHDIGPTRSLDEYEADFMTV